HSLPFHCPFTAPQGLRPGHSRNLQAGQLPGAFLAARNAARTASSVLAFPLPSSDCQKLPPLGLILPPVTLERADSAAVEHVGWACPPNSTRPSADRLASRVRPL